MSILQSIHSSARIIIVHPRYRQARHFLSTLLHQYKWLYIRCDENLNSDVFNEGQTYEIIILDEFDRNTDEDAVSLLEFCLQRFPNSRIVLFSRHFPNLAEHQRQIAAITPVDSDLGLVDYLDEAAAIVEIFALGLGRIIVNGKERLNCADVPEAYLIFYLLEKGRVKRKLLVEAFWPSVEKHTAIRNFHTVKQQLNELLGLELIIFKSGFYQLNPEFKLVYDVANYKSLFESVQFAESPLKLLQQVQTAYTGDFLQGLKTPWARNIRHRLRHNQAEIEALMGARFAQNKLYHEASACYAFAFKNNPARDDVLWELLRLLLVLRLPKLALGFYKRYEEVLREKHGILPNQRFEELIAALSA